MDIILNDLTLDELTTICARLGCPYFNEVDHSEEPLPNYIPAQEEPAQEEPVKKFDRDDVTHLAVDYMNLYSRDRFAELLAKEFNAKRAQDVIDEDVDKLCRMLEEAING